MADRKITSHTAITAASIDPVLDVIEVVDVSDTTDAATGTNKKMTILNLEGIVLLSGDRVNNNATPNTLENVTDLSFSVVTGGSYYFCAFIMFDSASATNGSRWTINGPATSTLVYNSRWSSSTTNESINNLNAYQLPAAASGNSAYGIGNWARIEGTLTASADGTVQVQFASELGGSAITAKANASFIKYRRLA